MLCLRCGFPRERHIRADGSCLDARCEAFVEKWDDTGLTSADLGDTTGLERVAAVVVQAPKADAIDHLVAVDLASEK